VVCRKTRRQFGVRLGCEIRDETTRVKTASQDRMDTVLPHFSHAPIIVQSIVPSLLTSGVKAHLSLRGDNFT